MKPCLIHIRPWHILDEERVDIRVGDGPSPEIYGIDGHFWQPAIRTRPQLSMELFDATLSGKVRAGTVRFALMLGSLADPKAALKYYWRSAPVTIWSAPNLTTNGAPVEFIGRVTSAKLDNDKRSITIQAEVSTQFIDKPLLTLEFTGAGGLNGDAALRGTLRPAGFGPCENIPPVWFDLTDNIGQIDGYGNTISITGLMEGAADMGPRVADYANYAALKAAIVAGTVPEGRWASSVYDGLIGLGAAPKGVIGANAVFGSNRSGTFARRIMEIHADVDVAKIDTAAFTALDAAVDRETHYWTRSQRRVKDLLEAIAGAANATPLVTFQEKVTITRAVPSSPVGTLDRSGQVEPRVLKWMSAEIDPPYYQIKARVARPANVLTDDQVFYEDDIVDRGVYDPATTYYQGNLVWDDYGAQYLYINATPAAGQPLPVPPATSTAYWSLKQYGPVPTYDDGTVIDLLRPAAIGADVTADNTAAAIEGQGTGATSNSLEDLDPTARAELDSALAGGGGSYAYGDSKQVRLAAGASVNVSGVVYINAGGSSSGSIQAILRACPVGGSPATFASGTTEPVTPTEPAQSYVDGIFTNSTGVEQIFSITLSVIRTPGTAGGSVDMGMSFFS